MSSRYVLSRSAGWVAAAAVAVSGAAAAQTAAEPSNQVSLSASAFKDVPEDWLTMVVRASTDAADAVSAQNQLKVIVEAALASLRAQAQPQQMEVRTGSFGIYPRHNNQGRVIGWQGSAEVVIEGRDFARVSAAAGKVPGMAVSSAGFSLSREGRQQLESQVQTLAVERFRQRAQELSRSFGFSGYTVRQVSVSSADQGAPVIAHRAMAAPMAMAAAADMAVPVEAGKATVHITVSGTVQMR
jgi:predicted secreted protein